MSTPDTAWALRMPAPLDAVRALTDELHVHPTLAAAVWARGLRTHASRRLRPELVPAPIPHLDEAAERLERAIERRERIVLHGDYDADGVTGTAVLTLGLRALGGRVAPFIPDRLGDGYGVSSARIDEHVAAADLFVTIDCGISNHDEVARLRSAGVDVIVTDHHVPGATLPAALVVHPALAPRDDDGTADLTGAGVAYHLLWALHRRRGLAAPLEYADLATVGTIADVAPLLGANRALVRAGLERMHASASAGLRALVGLNKLRGAVSAHHVAFVLAPRLNAAGRLGRSNDALELLTTGSDDRARVLATLLDVLNGERRTLQARMLEQALEIVDPAAPAVVIRHPEWHPGVMGIVASQVLERHYRPVFVVAQGKGSVRSTPGISAVAGLNAAGTVLQRWGGHAAAAGFSLDEANFEAFRDAIYDFVSSHPVPVRTVTADAVLRPDQVTSDLFAALAELEPYGQGHVAPRFAVRGPLTRLRAVGKGGDHLQLGVGAVKGVAWNRGHEAERWTLGGAITAFASLAEATYRDITTIELRAEALTDSPSLHLAPEAIDAHRSGAERHPSAPCRLRLGAPPARSADVTHITALVPDGLDPLAPLRRALAGAGVVHLDLDERALVALERAADAYPNVHDLRTAFVAAQRGRALPWSDAKATLARTALEELDLLDERGRARRAQRRDPYDAATLRASLVARHALDTLVNVIRCLGRDDAARAIAALVAPSGADGGDARTGGLIADTEDQPPEGAVTSDRDGVVAV